MTTRTTLPAEWTLEPVTTHRSNLLQDGQWRALIEDGGNTADTTWALTVQPEVSEAHLAAIAFGRTALDAAANWLAATN
jgi:hypothetical protein